MYSDDYPRKRRRVDQHVSTPAPLVVHQSRLYFDIFNEILKHVERVDSATLMNLCLVSKEWWYLAERKLYWYPQLKSLRSIEQLVRSLKGNVTLQDFIHSISFTLNMDISSQTDTTLTSQQRDGTCFLLRLQKLEHITLQGSCAHHVLPSPNGIAPDVQRSHGVRGPWPEDAWTRTWMNWSAGQQEPPRAASCGRQTGGGCAAWRGQGARQ